jgi:hypothetical protein
MDSGELLSEGKLNWDKGGLAWRGALTRWLEANSTVVSCIANDDGFGSGTYGRERVSHPKREGEEREKGIMALLKFYLIREQKWRRAGM